ncbi:mas-related G-protein coupled receptor member X2-like [Sorex araneus]|uniref:mas-related G-protein coupled receptor member X2-like n=1 Tax=Sorex araneus TaxID=42254 RepID=UPI002433B2EF|nr:mas-related G-protein coupled receptor member X2-like [Sorex araneus]
MDVTATAWVTESTLQYASDWEDFDRPLDMALLISGIVEFIISLVGLAGNAVVLWHLAFLMQRNAFSIYILNLAGGNFVCLTTDMPGPDDLIALWLPEEEADQTMSDHQAHCAGLPPLWTVLKNPISNQKINLINMKEFDMEALDNCMTEMHLLYGREEFKTKVNLYKLFLSTDVSFLLEGRRQSRNTSRAYLSMDVTATPWVTESTPQYTSDREDFDRPPDMAFLISGIVEFIISLAGLVENSVVFWLLAFRMQRNAFSIYILNLAGADFVCLCTHIVVSMLILVKYSKLYSKEEILNFSVAFFFPYIAGLSILTAISTERCLSVLKPLWYRYYHTKQMSSVMCALIWALSLLLTILELKFCGLLFGKYDEDLCRRIDFSIVTWLVFSFVLLFGSSLVLLTRLLCGSQKRKLTRLYVTIGLTVLVFLLCGLPWGISYFLLYWMPTVSFYVSFNIIVVTNVLACVNSCANPIIYFFVGSYRHQQRQQRRSLKEILQRALQDVPEEDRIQGSPPQETLQISGNTHVA